MENNEIIDRIKDLDESARLLLDYYKDDTYVDVYIYCLIASALKKYRRNKAKLINYDYEELLLYLISKVNKHNEIRIKVPDYKTIMSLIDKFDLSDRIYDILLLKLILNEEKINVKYKMEMHTTNIDKLNLLNKEYNKILNKEIENNLNINNYYIKIYEKNIKEINKNKTKLDEYYNFLNKENTNNKIIKPYGIDKEEQNSKNR